MDSEWVVDQTRLYLIEPLREYFRAKNIMAFVGGNSFVYYEPPATNLGPDFYVVRGGLQRGQTKWVAWEEGGLLPTTIIEFLSPSTETRDRGEKFCIYRDVFRTENYVLVDPDTLYVESFVLEGGHYVAGKPDADGWFFLNSLGLSLGVVDGWLRLRSPDGELLVTAREQALSERQRADAERQRADAERQRADRLADRLRELGLDETS
ncbi:MAG: hypothetical protein AMXMBFR33_72460 [Candidatus Xenobia bacterium]